MYAKNFELKKMILGNARMDVGGSPWMDHFLAVTIDAVYKELGSEKTIQVEVSAKLWNKATQELNIDERLGALMLITGKNISGYVINSHPEHIASRDELFSAERISRYEI